LPSKGLTTLRASRSAAAPPPPAAAEPEIEGAALYEAPVDAALRDEVESLLKLLDHEIGPRWMSLDLRLLIEKIEILLRSTP
jgi:hypothetical protein